MAAKGHKFREIGVRFALVALLATALLVVGSASTRAGFLADDFTAVTHGAVSLTKSVYGSLSFHADVEYAVYAPGTAPAFFSDPSGGQHYIYAYELSNTSDLDVKIQLFTLGLDSAVSVANIADSSNVAYAYAVPGDTDALGPKTGGAYFSTPAKPTSAVWDFNDAAHRIPQFGHSMILTYTSPNPPGENGLGWKSATLQGGAPLSAIKSNSPAEYLPVPVIPEPTTLGMLVVSALSASFVALFRCHRRPLNHQVH
jgi:hypothetical protein